MLHPTLHATSSAESGLQLDDLASLSNFRFLTSTDRVSEMPDFHCPQDYSKQSIVSFLLRCFRRGYKTNPMLNRNDSTCSKKCAVFYDDSVSGLTAPQTPVTQATRSVSSAGLLLLLRTKGISNKTSNGTTTLSNPTVDSLSWELMIFIGVCFMKRVR